MVNQKISNIGVSFEDVLSKQGSKSVLSELENKFGIKISVKAIPKTKEAVKSVYSNSVGKGNVTIAPNILNKMSTNPQLQNKVEAIIQDHFDSSVNDKPGDASGVIIHPDGTATFWVIGDYLTPAEREKIQKEVEADKKKKAEKLESLSELSSTPLSQLGLATDSSNYNEEANILYHLGLASLDSMLRKKNLFA
jgi:hypothetical protein